MYLGLKKCHGHGLCWMSTGTKNGLIAFYGKKDVVGLIWLVQSKQASCQPNINSYASHPHTHPSFSYQVLFSRTVWMLRCLEALTPSPVRPARQNSRARTALQIAQLRVNNLQATFCYFRKKNLREQGWRARGIKQETEK